jgi:hypothetical protein
MSTQDQSINAIARLVRVVVWGQLIGYLWLGVAVAVEDAPNLFLRAGIWSFVWPVLVLLAMHLFRLDLLLARRTPRFFIVIGTIALSIATVAASAMGVRFAFGVPDFLVTPGWRYSQGTSLAAMTIFTLALLASIILSVQALRSERPDNVPTSNTPR